MWIPDEIRKCTAFICIKDDNGKITPYATGFLVSSLIDNNSEKVSIYFVTAKHNVVNINERPFWIRLNNKEGNIVDIDVQDKITWFYHPDHSTNPADVAVLPFLILKDVMDRIDIKTIPVSMFVDEKLIKNEVIGVGADVFIIGLFTRVSGRQKNSPIVRVGNLAMIPNEKIPTKDFGDIEAYLVEARSIGGVSGSPVFFCESDYNGVEKVTKIGGPARFYLGGVIHGHFDEMDENPTNFIVDPNIEKKKKINMGIAIVTPANKIKEILLSNELTSKVKKWFV